jgi:hypothetical protein
MRDPDKVLAALAKSSFRQRFRLLAKERAYLDKNGLPKVLDHARDFIERRLSAANPSNDGKQTPLRGHPVFIAQHATGTCCRSCLEKWHGIRKGRPLADAEQTYIVGIVERWIRAEMS